MSFFKNNKGKIGIALAIILALFTAFYLTDKSPDDEAPVAENAETVTGVAETAEPAQEEETIEEPPAEEKPLAEEKKEEKPIAKSSEKTENFCTLSVTCKTLLSDISRLDESKRGLVGDGVIFAEKQVEFEEGESVFDLLLREMKENKIHLEFVNTPVYDSVYIEGIGNIYEFDAGELSGWMYKVNGEFPNYGCSKYILKNGDKVEFVYTCDLGKDVGGHYAENNGGQ